MSANTVLLVVTGLILCIRVYVLTRVWNQPLQHGMGYFLATEVPPGFYDGPGIRWLRRFRGVMLAEFAAAILALIPILVWSKWRYLIAWAPATGAVFVCALLLFSACAHRIRVMNGLQGVLILSLASYAVLRSWPSPDWLRFGVVGTALVFWLVMVAVILLGGRRLAAMCRDLRPVGSWSGPFRTRRRWLTSGGVWAGAYVLGLAVLLFSVRA